MGKYVEQKFAVGIGIEVAAITLAHFTGQLMRVGQIAVVREGDAVGAVDEKRLGFRILVGPGGRVAHMPQAGGTPQVVHVPGAESLAHEPTRPALAAHTVVIGHDAGRVLTPVLKHDQGIVDLRRGRAVTHQSDYPAHQRPPNAARSRLRASLTGSRKGRLIDPCTQVSGATCVHKSRSPPAISQPLAAPNNTPKARFAEAKGLFSTARETMPARVVPITSTTMRMPSRAVQRATDSATDGPRKIAPASGLSASQTAIFAGQSDSSVDTRRSPKAGAEVQGSGQKTAFHSEPAGGNKYDQYDPVEQGHGDEFSQSDTKPPLRPSRANSATAARASSLDT